MAIKGFNNSSKFFKSQMKEEFSHYRKIWKYLLDRNSRVASLQVPAIEDENLEDIVESFAVALDLEYKTTEEWKAIYNLAMDEKDWITLQLAQEFMDIQRVEEEEFQTINDELSLIKNDTRYLLLWDKEFEG